MSERLLVTGDGRIDPDAPDPDEAPIRFRLLGPVRAETGDGELALRRRQERCLLAILLLECGRVVPMRRLCELLWEGTPPNRAHQAVRSHVAHLRALLARVNAEPPVALVSDRHGYVLKV